MLRNSCSQIDDCGKSIHDLQHAFLCIIKAGTLAIRSYPRTVHWFSQYCRRVLEIGYRDVRCLCAYMYMYRFVCRSVMNLVLVYWVPLYPAIRTRPATSELCVCVCVWSCTPYCAIKADSQCKNAATSDLPRDQSPRQLSIHNVHVLATSRPPRPWYLHDVAGRKSPSTKRKWVPARQLWVLEPENFPPSLRASQGKRLWCCLCFQDYRFAFSAKDWSYCQNLK